MDRERQQIADNYFEHRIVELLDWLVEEAHKPQDQNDRENEEDLSARRLNEIHERKMDKSVAPWMERIPRETLLAIIQKLGSRDLSNFSATGHMQNNVSREARMRIYTKSENPLATFLISHGGDDFAWYISMLMRSGGIELDHEDQFIEANTGKALMIFVAAWSRRFTRHRRDVGIPPQLLVFLLKVQSYLKSWVYRPVMKDIVVACECLAAMIGLRRFHVYTNWSKADFDHIYHGQGEDRLKDYVFYESTISDIWPFQQNGWTVYNTIEHTRLLTIGFYNEHFSATRTGIALTKKLSRTLIFGLFLNQIEQTRIFKGVYLLPLTFALFTFVRSFIFSHMHSEYVTPRVYDSKLLWASEFKSGLDGPMRFVVQEFQLNETGDELIGSDAQFSGHAARWTSLAEAYEIVRMIGEKHNLHMLYYFRKRLIEYRNEHPLQISRRLVSRVLDDMQAKYGPMFDQPPIRHDANHVFFRFDELENMYTLMRDGRYARNGLLGLFDTDRSWMQVRANRLPLPEFIEDRVRLPAVRHLHAFLIMALMVLLLKTADTTTPDYIDRYIFCRSLFRYVGRAQHITEAAGLRDSSLNYAPADGSEPRFIGADNVLHNFIEYFWVSMLMFILYAIAAPYGDDVNASPLDAFRTTVLKEALDEYVYQYCVTLIFTIILARLMGMSPGGAQDILRDLAGGIPYLVRKLLKRRESLPAVEY